MRRKKPVRTKARIAMGKAIRAARRATGLTQEQLAMRVGLKGQALWRWESGDAVPSRRNQRALVTAIQVVNQPAAEWLAGQLASARASEGKPAVVQAVAPAVPPAASLELAVYGLAEDLELAPRRVRSALLPFLKRLRAAQLSVDAAERLLEQAQQAAQATPATTTTQAAAE